ncbi:MAG TPA: IclR family transcriptional regulator [Bryobacteraceae bacterium]|nr:IclR family transcriptional regulator [Bryobacteraceae bacterium]
MGIVTQPASLATPTNSLERALKLLEIIAHRSEGYTNSDLSHKLGIPTSSCSYMLSRLTREGYLKRANDGRYTIGLKSLILSHAALRSIGFRPFSEPVLYKIVEDTRLAANVGVLQGGRVLLIDRLESPNAVSDVSFIPRELRDIGIELDAHTTALGKVLLAALHEDELSDVIRRHGLERKTPKTIVGESELRAELKRVRTRGFSRVMDEHYKGFWSIGAPISDAAGVTRAAVSLSGTPEDPAWQNPDELARRVIQAGRDISRSMRLR